MQPPQTFKKAERLCNRKLIGRLFTNGRSFFLYPFKIIYLRIDQDERRLFSEPYPVQVLFTISKRRFKRAVDRNRLKRLMREGYRKNKHELYETLNEPKANLALGLVYTGREILTYQEIEPKIKAVIMRLKQEIKVTENKNANHVEP